MIVSGVSLLLMGRPSGSFTQTQVRLLMREELLSVLGTPRLSLLAVIPRMMIALLLSVGRHHRLLIKGMTVTVLMLTLALTGSASYDANRIVIPHMISTLGRDGELVAVILQHAHTQTGSVPKVPTCRVN